MIRVATRASPLSLAQTRGVLEALGRGFELVRITTRGDTDARPLFAMDQRGVFEREVDAAVADGRADFAVHSLKDVPSEIPAGLEIASVPKRGDPSDVVFSRGGGGIGSLAPGSSVGTSSLRRASQVRAARPDLRVVPVRGNVGTRMRRVSEGELDAVVLARAGLARLGVESGYSVLPEEEFLPSPGQGALALVCRAGDRDTLEMLKGTEDPDSRLEAEAERALSARLESGCRFPVGARARVRGQSVTVSAAAFRPDGGRVAGLASGPKSEARRVGGEAASQMLEAGAAGLALNWRAEVERWNAR